MPQQRDPFLWRVDDVVRGGGDFELVTEPWTGRDQVLFLDEISVCNDGHAGGDVLVGVLYGGHHFELDTVYNLVLGGWEYAHGKITILNKWQIFARFLYAQDELAVGDSVHLHVVGYVLEPYSSP